MSVKTAYLFAYNAFCTLAWAYTLFLALTALSSADDVFEFVKSGRFYEAVHVPLKLAQTVAIMEIIHAASRLVRSPVTTTFLQVFSRVGILWLVCYPAPESMRQVGFASMVLAWSLVECIRYPYYALSLLQAVPSALTWLRYSAFIVLYPLGIASEISCIFASVPSLQKSQTWSVSMPNKYNLPLQWSSVVVAISLLYLPGSPVMFGHMLRQRGKYLNGAKVDKADKKKAH
ncbi:MAG: hypothetical protein MHM6MM_007152 [Cercozoa sp. M6MM]